MAKGALSLNRSGDESHCDWLASGNLLTKSMRPSLKVSGDRHFLGNPETQSDAVFACGRKKCRFTPGADRAG